MFTPGATNPEDLDAAMRAALADSLEHVHAVAGRPLGLPSADVQEAMTAIRSHRVAPGVFGRYYKTVLAVEAREFGPARERFREIIDLARRTPHFSALPYTEAALGREKALYGDLVNPGGGAPTWIGSPPTDDGFGRRVRDCLAMIEAADPALAMEIRALAIQVVGAAPSGAPGAMAFGSASSFMLWGLIVVNVERYPTAADLIQGLVHEAAHLLLFAHSIDEPLVTNDIEERYLSPLRPDPRPMDGIIHATFVSARLHYVNAKLRQATGAGFAPVSLEELDSRLAMLRGLCFGGVKTVREHAKLTRSGRDILEETLAYMSAG